jgi:hypothetical protein
MSMHSIGPKYPYRADWKRRALHTKSRRMSKPLLDSFPLPPSAL